MKKILYIFTPIREWNYCGGALLLVFDKNKPIDEIKKWWEIHRKKDGGEFYESDLLFNKEDRKRNVSFTAFKQDVQLDYKFTVDTNIEDGILINNANYA